MGLIRSVTNWFSSSSRDPEDDSLYSSSGFFGWGRRRTASGKIATPETSLQLSAYYAAIRNISEDIGKARMLVFDIDNKNRKTINRDSPASKLLMKPSPDMTPFTVKQTTVANALGWGNGYLEIVRDQLMRPIELVPLHPSTVIPSRNPETLELEYIVYTFDLSIPFSTRISDKRIVKARDMVHILGLSPDGLVGYSVVRYAAEQMGEALAAQEFGGSFYGNGMTFGGFFQHPNQLSKEAQDRLLESVEKKHGGSRKAYKNMILEEGMVYKPGSIPPKDAQFIESRRFHTEEIARWFRIPPHKIGDLTRSTNNNIEEQSLSYLGDTLSPWMRKIEEEFARKLIPQDGRVIEFNEADLLPADLKSRGEFHRSMVSMGIETPNQARQALNMNTADDPELDRYYMQGAMMPIEKLGETGPTPPPTDGSNDSKVALDMSPLITASACRVHRREEKALQGKKDPDQAWVDKFYEGQLAMLVGEVETIAQCFSISVNTTWLSNYIDARREDWQTAPQQSNLIDAINGALNHAPN